ncbi:MAG: amidohydrolase [Ignavibacteria bacterium]|nr:amidohydrolase [Ignavibacteria bacterium]
MKVKIIINILLFITVSICFLSCSKVPDIIYINGKIYTLDDNNTVAEAVAVRDGKVMDIGKSEELLDKYKIPNTIDLEGNTVIPGLIDCEGSLIEFSQNYSFVADLRAAKNLADINTIFKQKIKISNEGSWISGFYFIEQNFNASDLNKIDRYFLDSVAPNHNIYIVSYFLPVVICNSKALNTLKIDKNTKVPSGGEIEIDEKGELTGRFFESATNLIKEKIPKEPSKEDMLRAVELGANEMIKNGVTCVQDRTVGLEGINIFKKLIDEDKFPLRIYAVLSAGDTAYYQYINKGIEVNYKDKLTIRAVSLDYDGAFIFKESKMIDEYKDKSTVKGEYSTDEEVEKIFRDCLEKRFQVRIKTVGDKAVRNVIAVIEKVLKEKNINEHRTVFEYIQFTRPEEISKIKELKIIPSVVPAIPFSELDSISKFISPENLKNLALWNFLVKECGLITCGSDFPYQPVNPFVHIYLLVTRQFPDTMRTDIPSPNQKLSIYEALKSYSKWAAFSAFEEESRGTLEKGKYADMVVISNDIFTSEPAALLSTKVLMTILNGKIVYNSEE